MKTCPNPQCRMTDISDDFKFCPKCGTALVADQWNRKYRDLTERRDELVQKKAILDQFEKERNQMFSILDRDEMFQAEKATYKAALKEIKTKEWIASILGFLGAAAIIVVFIILNRKEILILDDKYNLIPVAAMLLFIIVKDIIHGRLQKNRKKHLLEIKPKILDTFISKYFELYKEIFDEKKEDNILKLELDASKQVKADIRKYIEKTEQSILDIDANLRSIEAL